MAQFLTQADDPGGPSMLARLRTIPRRVLAWPVSGFAEPVPLPGWAAAFITALALICAPVSGRGITRQFGFWTAVTTIWAVVALSFIAPSLATPFVGLPTDQYHTWLDPILFATIGTVGARLWTTGVAPVPKIAAVALVGSCIALSLASQPPLSSPDGGWPRAVQTAARIRSITADHTTAVIGVEKSGAAIQFPLRRQRSPIGEPSRAEFLVVTCDLLFFRASVLPCGGPAEEACAREVGFAIARVVDRFADGPRRTISVFTNH
jgi:hypothetical protein